ncbi:DUF1196 domain-containing protein [Vibrio cholerae]|nr:DUF1196 domain-containing protein [Vibrio cholerae]TQP40191.1 DUF1196 domain-containing protein [Vibrio cholerae]TXX85291.1 DUF1196 domain-containing protein [Vibrio cholerae]
MHSKLTTKITAYRKCRALTVPLEAFVMCVLLTANRDKAL